MLAPLVRPARADDFVDLHAVALAVIDDGRGVVHTRDSASKTPDELRAAFQAYLDDTAQSERAMLVVEDAGRAAGYGNIYLLRPPLVRHVAVLSIEVAPSAQRRGLGRALLRGLVAWADSHAIERVELYTRDDNTRAIGLYESEGFVHEGTRARFVKLPDGTYVDDRIYVRFAAARAPAPA